MPEPEPLPGANIPPQPAALSVLMVQQPGTRQLDGQQAYGYEYDLLTAFAAALNRPLSVRSYPSTDNLLFDWRQGMGDLAAAVFTRSGLQKKHLQTSAALLHQRPVWLCACKAGRHTLKNWPGNTLHLLKQDAALRWRSRLKDKRPNIQWRLHPAMALGQVLQHIQDHADEGMILLAGQWLPVQGRYPDLCQHVLDLPNEEQVLLTRQDDLAKRFHTFLEQQWHNGALKRLWSRYYPPTAWPGQRLDMQAFQRRIEPRLKPLADSFRIAARQTGLDWRWLAAMSYQESHWNRHATSPTGVRGIMMLTQDAAREVGVHNRLHAAKNIAGGARYLKSLYDKLPQRINNPDRLWLALAAYNIGFSALEKARIRCQRQGKNPDWWDNISVCLPTYRAEKTAYSQRSRGQEAVDYVTHIRGYFSVLRQLYPESSQANTVF